MLRSSDPMDAVYRPQASVGRKRSPGRRLLALLLLPLKLALLITLPFALLIRGSVYLYLAHGWPSWLALVTSGAVTTVVLILYFALAYALLNFIGSLAASRFLHKTKRPAPGKAIKES